MRSYRYLHLDVFTDDLFGGNQLAVFLDGRGLSTAEMQSIAKEMAFSETTFLLPPDAHLPLATTEPDPGADASANSNADAAVRIFTPGAELKMAGHPTIGTTFALARSGIIVPGQTLFTFKMGVGEVFGMLAFDVWHLDIGTLAFRISHFAFRISHLAFGI